jgi:hypothetical protein
MSWWVETAMDYTYATYHLTYMQLGTLCMILARTPTAWILCPSLFSNSFVVEF